MLQIQEGVQENARRLQNLETDVSQLTRLMVTMEQQLSTCVRMLAVNMYSERNDDRSVSVNSDEHVYSSFDGDNSENGAENGAEFASSL